MLKIFKSLFAVVALALMALAAAADHGTELIELHESVDQYELAAFPDIVPIEVDAVEHTEFEFAASASQYGLQVAPDDPVEMAHQHVILPDNMLSGGDGLLA